MKDHSWREKDEGPFMEGEGSSLTEKVHGRKKEHLNF